MCVISQRYQILREVEPCLRALYQHPVPRTRIRNHELHAGDAAWTGLHSKARLTSGPRPADYNGLQMRDPWGTRGPTPSRKDTWHQMQPDAANHTKDSQSLPPLQPGTVRCTRPTPRRSPPSKPPPPGDWTAGGGQGGPIPMEGFWSSLILRHDRTSRIGVIGRALKWISVCPL